MAAYLQLLARRIIFFLPWGFVYAVYSVANHWPEWACFPAGVALAILAHFVIVDVPAQGDKNVSNLD